MKTLVKYLHQLCGVYTVSVLLLLLLNIALGSSMTQTTVNTAAFLWLFLFASLLAAANLQLLLCRFSYVGRVVLHCLIAVGSCFCFLYLPTNVKAAASSKLLMLVLMLIVYWVIMALYLVLRPKTDEHTATKAAAPYRSMFGSKREN
ncbi:MAG: hypothetical protein IJY66_07940 [Clostridia bacterium]|nr:hypothetical protein [Clostridia bacterium]